MKQNILKGFFLIVLCVFFVQSNEIMAQEDSSLWALPRISVAHIRVKPAHSAELSSQAIMGMPIKLLKKDGDWWHVETPEGYVGYIIGNSLSIKTNQEISQWKRSERVVVSSFFQTHILKYPSNNSIRDVITDVVNGVILEGEKTNKEFTKVKLPDGREGYIKSSEIIPIKKWAKQEFNSQLILDLAYSMHGLPYLWGGTSIKSLDCSGLAKVCYYANGIILRRDAYQQAETGVKINSENWQQCKAGDLLFFGNDKTQKVTHVAIYNENGMYIHASGRVKVNSIDPQSELYLSTPFFHACRINGSVGSDGIIQAINHPWYFNQ